MKRMYLSACAAIGLLGAVALPVIGATRADPIAQEVSKANDIVQLATIQHDRKTMDSMLTPDFVLVLTHGNVLDRKGWLDSVEDPTAHIEVNQTSNLSIHDYNGDSALVIGVLHLRYHQNAKLTDVRMRFIDVWVKQNGQWKWASSQVAHFPDR